MKMFHVKHRSPHALLINPWITDFAAYNFWIKPHGLLSIASLLRDNGFKISFIDCLDSTAKRKKYGDGKFLKIEIEKPLPLKSIPRKYSQYGISEEIFRDKLSCIEKPDLIGITSGMTYWYPGVFKVIRIVKESFKEAPILLGGIYATLCYDHAVKYSEADYVIQARGELELSKIISELLGLELSIVNCKLEIDDFPYPAFDLYPRLDYVSIMTSRGCPYRCSYCASSVISEGFKRRDPLKVVEEITCWTSQYRVSNIAFYDDALLVNPSEHIIKILKEVRKRDIQCNFHSPNGLHIKEINKEVAALLYDCQFKTLRLGLETSSETIQVDTGGKVDNRSFREAVGNLRRAGYSKDEIGTYVMAGLPGQRVGEVEESIAFVEGNGAKPILVEYSPIPETALFEKAVRMSEFDLENEPLLQNNSIFPCQWEGFTLADLQRLKREHV
jgi:radical SAM superfamily enzyme YgiQ (UPF0313 family)